MKAKVHDLSLSNLRLKESVRMLALAGLVSLGGCFGDGDDPVAVAPAPAPAAAGAVVVAGGVGGGAAVAGVRKAAVIAGATVEVALFTPAGVQVDLQTQISNAAGGYELTVNDPTGLLANGGYVVVNVKRDGFADASSRVDFSSRPERLQIPDVELSSVITSVAGVVANADSTFGLPGAARAVNGSFVMGIVRMRDGSRKAMAGNQFLAAKAAGGQPDLEIAIPERSLAGTGVETIQAQMRQFDPNIVADARNFPGAYKDTNGNTIVSLGFDYMNLTDGDTGQNIGQVAAAARAARGLRKAAVDFANNPTVVTRYLPTGSANNLLRDACGDPNQLPTDMVISNTDPTVNCTALRQADADGQTLGNEAADGFQLPIYTYVPSKGVWELLGIGSLVQDYDGNAASLLTYDEVAAFYGKLRSQVTAADFRAYAADNRNQLNVRIYVTNETFQRQYWNLDYPLLFAAPVTLCVQGRVIRRVAGIPDEGIPGLYLSFGDNDSPQTFSYGSTSTDANGNYKISVILQSGASDQATDRTGSLSYYNNFDRSYVPPVDQLVANEPNCTVNDIALTPPLVTTVSGRVLGRDGAPKQGEWVWGQAGSRSFSATTGSDGRFSAEVRQNTTYSVHLGNDGNSRGSFTPNGAVNGMETSDTTTVVELNDILLVNRAPVAYGYPFSSSLRLKRTDTTAATRLYLWGYDYDNDFPVNWQVLNNATCNADGTFSGTPVTGLSGVFARDDYNTTQDIALGAGSHALVLGLTDNGGKQGCTTLGTINVAPALANRAPVIAWLTANQGNFDQGTEMTFTSYSYELDAGDLMTGTWGVSAGTLLCTNPVQPVAAGSAVTCKATAPNVDTPVTVTWTVTDGERSTTRSIQVQVGTPPSDLNVIVR
jgi:hypothetical protein